MNDELKSFVDFLIKKFVSNPDSAYCQVVKNNDVFIVEIYCDEKDKGRIIGKNGKTIKAIRTLSRLWGGINRQRVDLVLM